MTPPSGCLEGELGGQPGLVSPRALGCVSRPLCSSSTLPLATQPLVPAETWEGPRDPAGPAAQLLPSGLRGQGSTSVSTADGGARGGPSRGDEGLGSSPTGAATCVTDGCASAVGLCTSVCARVCMCVHVCACVCLPVSLRRCEGGSGEGPCSVAGREEHPQRRGLSPPESAPASV